MQENQTQSPTPGAQLVRSADIVMNYGDEQIKTDQRSSSSVKINKVLKVKMYRYFRPDRQPN